MWLVWSLWTVLAVASDARSADRELATLRDDLDIRALLEGDGVQSLTTSAHHFAAISRRLDTPLLAPLRIAPILGRQLSAVSDQANGATAGLKAAATLIDELEGLVDTSLRPGPGRMEAFREIAAVATAGRPAFEGLYLGTDEALVGQLSRSRQRIEAARVAAIDALDRTAAVSEGLATFFKGPSDYLLLAANNSQMQNGQGMFLSAGVLHVADGRLELVSMEPTSDIPPATTPVELDPDLAARWGWLDPNGDYRHLGLSHRFPITAATAADLWVAAGRAPVDGVMMVDPVLLQVIMEASGPVRTRYKEVAAKGILHFVLHDQYQVYLQQPGRENSYIARQDQLGDIAKEALHNFDRVDSVGPEFLERFAAAVGGRHLLGWSPDTTVQAAWEAAGIDGQISPNAALLSFVNRSGNKLDWFLRTSAKVTVTPDDEGYEAEVRITVKNEAPAEGEPAYVVGPYPGSGLAAGEYLGLVTLNLPEAAVRARFEGVDQPAVSGGDGRNRTVSAWIRVARGTSEELVARFRLPVSTTTMTLEPSGRMWPTVWTWGGSRWTDVKPYTLNLAARR